MSGDHDHPHGHSHDHAHDHSGRKKIAIAAALTGTFMLAEAAGGLISGSLALLADAGHMLVDFAGLMLAYLAIRFSARPANAKNTFGYDRLPILVAFGNGLVLFFIAGWILVEAARRLASPVEILAGPMLAVAIGGLVVNIVAFFVLHGGDKDDLNLRGALLHVIGDLLGSVAAIVASLVILVTAWTPIDPILSVLVCLIILGNAFRLVRDSGHILLEGAPSGIDAPTLRPQLLASVAGLTDIHHLHVWQITPKRRAATLHARIADGTDAALTVREIKRMLAERFDISHATIEIELADSPCADLAEEQRHDHDHGDARHPHRHGGAETRAGAPTARHTHLTMIGAPA